GPRRHHTRSFGDSTRNLPSPEIRLFPITWVERNSTLGSTLMKLLSARRAAGPECSRSAALMRFVCAKVAAVISPAAHEKAAKAKKRGGFSSLEALAVIIRHTRACGR